MAFYRKFQFTNSIFLLSKADIKALLDNVQDLTKNVAEDATRGERKKFRDEKMSQFKVINVKLLFEV